jgi:hypothetical protein
MTRENPEPKASDVEALERERYELLQRLEDWLETPMRGGNVGSSQRH